MKNLNITATNHLTNKKQSPKKMAGLMLSLSLVCGALPLVTHSAHATTSHSSAELHSSLSGFQSNEIAFTTSKFQVRVDNMKDGTFRYASWGINDSTADKPDIVLFTDERYGAEDTYYFNSGNYGYLVFHNSTGEYGNTKYFLEVHHNNTLLIEQKSLEKIN